MSGLSFRRYENPDIEQEQCENKTLRNYRYPAIGMRREDGMVIYCKGPKNCRDKVGQRSEFFQFFSHSKKFTKALLRFCKEMVIPKDLFTTIWPRRAEQRSFK